MKGWNKDKVRRKTYYFIGSVLAIGQYRSPYHERRDSIVSVLLYGIPLVLVLLMILVSGDFRIEENVFPLVLVSIFGLNLINYGLSVFAEE
jgi:hypothetical protein